MLLITQCRAGGKYCKWIWLLNLIRMTSCVLITNRRAAAKHLLQFSDPSPRAKPHHVSSPSQTPGKAKPQCHPQLGTAVHPPTDSSDMPLVQKCPPWWLLEVRAPAGHLRAGHIPSVNCCNATPSHHMEAEIFVNISDSLPVNSHKQEAGSAFAACFLYVLTVKGKEKMRNAVKKK